MTYKFGKYEDCDCYEYFAIHKKSFWGGWTVQKTWGLSTLGTHSKEFKYGKRKANSITHPIISVHHCNSIVTN